MEGSKDGRKQRWKDKRLDGKENGKITKMNKENNTFTERDKR